MFRWKILVVILLGMLGTAAAQINVGQMSQIGMTGTIGTGYSGTYSDTPQSSSHNVPVNGDGDLNGYYFNPNFLNFNVHPYYGRTQESTNTVSIGENSGFSSSASIFGGSPFPGSVAFSKSFDSTGQYAIPGSTSLVTHGSGSNFTIGWSEHLNGLPQLSASLSHSISSGDVVGVEGTNRSNFNSLNISGSYKVASWPINANFTHHNNSSSSPGTLTGIGNDEQGSGSYWQINTYHPVHFLPGGSMSLGYTHGSYSFSSNDTIGDSQTGDNSSNSANSTLSFAPSRNVTVNAQANYTDNALSSNTLQLLSSGAVLSESSPGPLRSLSYSGSMSWNVPHGFMLTGGGTRIQQYYNGTEYDSTQAWGTATYTHSSVLGSLYLMAGMDDSVTQNGNTGMGFWGIANFERKFRGYDVSAGLSYSQHTQTIASWITSSGVSYSTSVSKKIWGGTYGYVGFNGGRSVLSSNSGQNHQERINAGLTRRRASISTFWGQSHNYTTQTASGLVASGVDATLLGGTALTSTSTNYGVSGSLTPIRRMSLVASFSKSHGSTMQNYGIQNYTLQDYTTQEPVLTTNSSSVRYLYLRYRLRKMYFTASYTRLLQGVTSNGTPLHPVTSYSFALWRSLKLF